MRSIIKTTAIVILSLSVSAVAVAATPPETPSEGQPPIDPPAFVNSAAQAGMTEVEMGNLALKASRNEAVRAFATRMVADHTKANADLAAIAKKKSIPVPTKLDAEHAKVVQSFQGQSGPAFDSAYARHMVDDHTEALKLFQANVASPDGELAAFAGKTLNVLQDHKRLADNLDANINKR